jgi:hypothetical protein
MTKVDIKRLDSITKNDTTATEQINDNFKALQEAIENTLSRDGTGPNFMDADLDMNSYRIINSADPVEDNDIVNLKYVEERIGGAVESAKTATAAATQAANSAQSALVSSTNAINTLRNAEEQLSNVIQYVEEAEQGIEDTINDALADVKQQALDAAQESIDTAAAQATEIVINYANNEIKPQLNEIVANAEADAENAAESAEIASNESEEAKHWADDARVWATGEDAEVEEIAPGEEEHSSRGYADLAMAIANTPEDVPLSKSKLMALDVIKGPKGDKGDKGEDGKDGKNGTNGEGLEIGDIGFAPFGIDESQNKRRYLNGQVISQAQFVSFTNKVKAAIQLTPSLATSETNWQAEVTNSVNGTCGKFVIDDEAGTIRLPKYPEYVSKEYVEAAVVGNGMTLGLYNGLGNLGIVEGNVNGMAYTVTSNDAYGKTLPSTNSNPNHTENTALGVTTDPTKSGIVADLANATTETIPCKWFIQVALGVEESVDVTREIELNNPFSLLDYKWSEYELNNASWLLSNGAFHSGTVYKAVYELLLKLHNGTETKDGVSVKLSTEAYTDTDFVINTADTTFRLPIKVKLASGNAVVGNGMSLGLTDGTSNAGLVNFGSSSLGHLGATTQDYGDNIGAARSGESYPAGDKVIGVTTDPTKSGIETSSSGLKLYFYVGETVQDANVINTSKVLDLLAKLEGYDYVVESKIATDDDPTWYRVYKSGWVEQGGKIESTADATITLLKPYANTDYTITVGGGDPTSGTWGYGNVVSATQISVGSRGTSFYKGFVHWQTCGQGA